MKFNGVSKIGKQCRMEHARQFRWVKTKKATKKTKVKDEFFPKPLVFKIGVFFLVAGIIIAVNPNSLKSTVSYFSSLAKDAYTVQQVSAQEYMELKNPVVEEPESNLHPKVIPIVLREATPSAQAEKSVDVSFPQMQDNSFADYIKSSQYGPIIARQWILESNQGTKGHAVQCRMNNQYNDFGLAVYGSTYTCFKTFEESVDRMVAWWNKWGTDNLDKKLCIYNKGPNSVEAKLGKCEYSLNFWRLQ